MISSFRNTVDIRRLSENVSGCGNLWKWRHLLVDQWKEKNSDKNNMCLEVEQRCSRRGRSAVHNGSLENIFTFRSAIFHFYKQPGRWLESYYPPAQIWSTYWWLAALLVELERELFPAALEHCWRDADSTLLQLKSILTWISTPGPFLLTSTVMQFHCFISIVKWATVSAC